MTNQEFLTKNKSQVIEFFNREVKNYYTVSMNDFGTDLLLNFRKITLGQELKGFDLSGNLQAAKSRLGLMSQDNFEYAQDKVTAALSKKYTGTSYMSLV